MLFSNVELSLLIIDFLVASLLSGVVVLLAGLNLLAAVF